MRFSQDELEAAADLVHRQMAPTPQYDWPGLSAATGAEVWVKHENHAPTGAFKVRGGITFMDWLAANTPTAPASAPPPAATMARARRGRRRRRDCAR